MMPRFAPRQSLVGLLLFAVAGCVVAVGDVPELARRLTYPPDFRYIERDTIHGAMWQLAIHSREVTRLVREDGDIAARHASIVGNLRGMEAAAASLDAGGKPTNHPLLENHLPLLRQDIQAARVAAERDPPNYFLAATVAGSCLPCHSGAAHP